MTMTSEVKLEPTAEEIERVARAFCRAQGYDPDFMMGRMDVGGMFPAWQCYETHARAAILAMDRRASPPAVCDVATMHTSSGLPDYFARVTVGDRSLEFFMSKIKGQADYHAAELDWLLNGAEKPDILAFDYTEPEGLAEYLAARASPPAPAVAVPEGYWLAPDEPTDDMLDAADRARALPEHFIREVYAAARAAAPQPPATRSEAQPPYPEGEVVGPCVCGSWPGGRCLRCEWRPATRSYEEGKRDWIEAAARIVEGQPYGEGADNPARYRTWAHWPTLPNGTKGNRGVDDFLVKHCDALATAIRSLADEPRHGE
jgi:hypothetical protein